MRRALILPFLIFSFSSYAAEPVAFRAVPEASSLRYETTQDGAKVTGSFPAFQSNIFFHPEALDLSKAEVTIDMAKVTTEYEKARDMIGSADWLSVQSFPKATFATQSFKFLGGKRYEAAGQLTIKNISVPTVMTFTLDEFSADAAKITGEAIIRRKDFKIGWDDTVSVANDVKVLVSLTAKAAKP